MTARIQIWSSESSGSNNSVILPSTVFQARCPTQLRQAYFESVRKMKTCHLNLLICCLRGCFQRIQTRAAAKGLVKRGAEVTQAVVTHFKRGLSDIVFAGFQQFGGAFHAQLPQMLGDGMAGLGGKYPAQIEMAAADFFPEFLQGRRPRQILFKQKNHLLDAFLREALLACAEHFLLRRRLEEKGKGQFKLLHWYQQSGWAAA